MKESDFHKEVVKNLTAIGAYCKKLDDRPGGNRCKQPFDLFGSYNGKSFAIECKQKKKYGSFSKSDLNGDQEKTLTDYENQGGGKAFVFLDIRLADDYSHIFIFSWKNLKKIWEKGSIKKEELKKMEYIEGVKGYIRFTKFIKMI
jgi:penicillin-binding protein-related factor A (putative recombinase)